MKNKFWVLVLIALAVAIYFFTKDSSEATVAEEVTTEDVVVEDWIEYIQDRPFNDKRYYISNQKLKELGWIIKKNLQEELNNLL